MSVVSDAFNNSILATFTGSTVYLACCTGAAPAAADGTGGTEVSVTSTGYGRAATTFTATSAATPTGRKIASSADVVFTNSGGTNMGTVQSYEYWRTSTGRVATDYLGGSTLQVAKPVSSGDSLTFPAGTLVVQFAA